MPSLTPLHTYNNLHAPICTKNPRHWSLGPGPKKLRPDSIPARKTAGSVPRHAGHGVHKAFHALGVRADVGELAHPN
eukprot:8698258-Lingulodinium_polyedra.AAC.1